MNNQVYIPVSPFGPDRWSDVPMCDGDGVGKDFPVCSFSIGWEWGRDSEQSGQSGPVIRTQINKAETDNIWKPVTSSEEQTRLCSAMAWSLIFVIWEIVGHLPTHSQNPALVCLKWSGRVHCLRICLEFSIKTFKISIIKWKFNYNYLD